MVTPVDLINHPTRRPQKPWTPELDRRHVVIESGHNDVLGGFLDHLQRRGIVLGRWATDREDLYEIHESNEQLLADFFDLDLHKIEREKLALLGYIRACNSYDDDRRERAAQAVAHHYRRASRGVDE